MSRKLGILVALLLVASLLAACGGGGSQGSGSTTSSAPSSSSTQSAGGQEQRIEVAGTDFAFNPNTLTVRRGQPVTIVFRNNGRVNHDLAIADFGVATPVISPGQNATITFTPDRTGQFRIVCREPGHEASGMVATLTVQ